MPDIDDVNEIAGLYSRLPRYQRLLILWRAKMMNRRVRVKKVLISVLLGVLVGLGVNNIMQPSPAAVWAAFLAGYYTSVGFVLV